MKLRVLQFYDVITSSFWFVPAVMALLAAAGAYGSVSLDRALKDGVLPDNGWIWSGSATGARSVLSTVAGSVMTVVSIVFSITITVLAQVSSKFGPRVLRNFTSDRGNQITLGTFIATFIYCLLVLRTVRDVEETVFVPDLSVTIGVGLAIASLAVLIYFIHHVSQSIQAEHLIADIGHEFRDLLPVLFPERIGHEKDKHEPDEEEAVSTINWDAAYAIAAPHSGYLQRIVNEKLLETACNANLIVRLEKRPGDFVAPNTVLMRAWSPAEVDEQTKQRLQSCFGFGHRRTPHQDIIFPMQQLVEIAALALSPGINEPFTAMTCIDWLGASLRGITMRTLPSPFRRDDNGTLRVIAQPYRFEHFAAVAFNQIRYYGSENPDLVAYLLQTIASLAPYLHREEDRQSLIHHVQLIRGEASKIHNEADRLRVENILQQTLTELSSRHDLAHELPDDLHDERPVKATK